jgi:ankyrin repeat protein
MIGMGHTWRLGMLAILLATVFPACRKPADASKSDLAEAGYQLTAEDWFRAARTDDTTALKRFVQGGFKADTRDSHGDTALHAAAAAGAPGAADFMLDHGLDSNVRGAMERTPLMAAAAADQASMVRWLIKQGADPQLKDQEGFNALMLAVREGRSAAVAELAVVHGENLDSALLLAALTGQAAVIDTLTNYGASVYARMEDGRTPLMLAAQNGHKEAVALLLDIGASRFSTDASGQTAAALATAANHTEIAALILREPAPADLALETPEQIALHLEPAAPDETQPNDINSSGASAPIIPIEGQTLSAAVMPEADQPASQAQTGASDAKPARFAMPPLVMRRYREREVPVRLKTVSTDVATLEILGPTPTEIQVKPGEAIPGSPLLLVSATRRMQDSKLNLGAPMEVSVVEVRDSQTGATREWISGEPATAHDPVALVEDAATGRRYAATPGRRFKSADGSEFIVADIRPNQIVIEDAATGAVKTLPLRGPRG